MVFKVGDAKPATSGRKAGTPNKINSAVAEKLAKMKCDPFVGMAKIAKKAMAAGDYELAGKMFNYLSPYVEPKLSSSTIDANVTHNTQDQSVWDLSKELGIDSE